MRSNLRTLVIVYVRAPSDLSIEKGVGVMSYIVIINIAFSLSV